MVSSWKPPPGDSPLQLNFHNHCLLCLQHVNPHTLQAIASENPKGLTDFQPVLQYLTGTLQYQALQDKPKWSHFPVTSEMPPLCTICYDILAELHSFHFELLEIQRKIQKQTEAARGIAKATTRRNGGTRKEFFKRLRMGGLPPKEVEHLEGFLLNLHGLIEHAEQQPLLSPSATFGDPRHLEGQPYSVHFTEPQLPSKSVEPDEEVYQVNQEHQHEIIEGANGKKLVLQGSTSQLQFEYEGDEEEELDQKQDMLPVQVELGEGEGSEEEEEKEDVSYWKNALSSQVIIEDVDEEQQSTEPGTSFNGGGVRASGGNEVELIELDDDDDEEEDDEEYSWMKPGEENYEEEYATGQSHNQPMILSVRGGVGVVSGQSNQVTTSGAEEPSKHRYFCKTCGAGYMTKQRLKYHEQGHLPGGRPKPYECGACGKTFASRKLLEQHTRIHTGERPYSCEWCGDKFRQGSTLYRHRMAHIRQQNGLNARRSRIGTQRSD